MSNARGHKGFAPTIDLAPAISAVEIAVKKSVKVTRLGRIGRKPKKSMTKPYSEMQRATKAQRDAFALLTEATFYGGRYTIRPVGDGYEIWDAESHDVYGPYRTFDDARGAVRRLT